MEVSRQLLNWKHNGFSLDAGNKPVAAHNAEGRRQLAEYLLRAPFSLEKITWVEKTRRVIYRSRRSWRIKRNFEVFTATNPASRTAIQGGRQKEFPRSTRETIARLIREWQADLVFTHRPHDYHPDHRNAGLLIRDTAFMVGVPFYVPDTPPVKRNPVFMYFPDRFTRPYPFQADIAISIDDVFGKKCLHLTHWNHRFTRVPRMAPRRRLSGARPTTPWRERKSSRPVGLAVTAALLISSASRW